MIPNPHYVGAPARMSDGRLFTDYRANCQLLPTLDGSTWEDHNRRVILRNSAPSLISEDRRKTILRAGSARCVDTMVPELTKRAYAWNGPVGEQISQPVGIGAGRMYLPGRLDLLSADPDTVAVATIPPAMLPGTFSGFGGAHTAPMQLASAPIKNRFSAPYGN